MFPPLYFCRLFTYYVDTHVKSHAIKINSVAIFSRSKFNLTGLRGTPFLFKRNDILVLDRSNHLATNNWYDKISCQHWKAAGLCSPKELKCYQWLREWTVPVTRQIHLSDRYHSMNSIPFLLILIMLIINCYNQDNIIQLSMTTALRSDLLSGTENSITIFDSICRRLRFLSFPQSVYMTSSWQPSAQKLCSLSRPPTMFNKFASMEFFTVAEHVFLVRPSKVPRAIWDDSLYPGNVLDNVWGKLTLLCITALVFLYFIQAEFISQMK